VSKRYGNVFIDFDPAQTLGVGNNKSYVLQANPSYLGRVEAETAKEGIEITSPKRIELIKSYMMGEKIIHPCYSYCKDMLINPFGDPS
jgi:hypothetical protein